MRYTILWVNLLIALSACHYQQTDEYFFLLQQADALSDSAPDSAHAILNSIERPEEMNNRNFAYWCLISGKVFGWRTDNEKIFLSESYFERATNYYMRYGTSEEKSFIRFYLGKAYQKKAVYNKAIQIYTEALKDAENWKEYDAAGMICCHMGDLYQIQYLSDKCKEKYNESLTYFRLANNPKRIAYVYGQLGFEFFCDEKTEEGLSYLLQADSIATMIKDSMLMSDMSYYIGLGYSQLEKYSNAEKHLLKGLRLASNKQDSAISLYAIRNLYIQAKDYKKAHEILISDKGYLTKNQISFQEYMIKKDEQNFEQALASLESWQRTLDSINSVQKKMHVLEIEQKYNREYTENQKNRAQIQADRYFILSLIILIIILLVILHYLQVRKQKNSIIYQQREALNKSEGIITHISEQLQHEKDKVSQQEKEQQKRIARLKDELFIIKLEKITQLNTTSKKIRRIAANTLQEKNELSANE